jgi:hypothetical protein
METSANSGGIKWMHSLTRAYWLLGVMAAVG